jgi:TonB-dependent starch-binding outer membrane protein SusC
MRRGSPYGWASPSGRGVRAFIGWVRHALVWAVILAAPAAAQNGRIAGRVTEAATGRVVVGVQISLGNTGLGAVSGADGTYAILNVPPGMYTVNALRIGYKIVNQSVTVASGQAATANFELATEVLGLDEIVVTGTAGAARRREVGNSISQINLSQVTEPVQSVDALLQARVPGMSVITTSGQVGSGAMIRLRGNVSVAQSNQPILYVDGVRVRSDGYARNVPPSGSSLRSNNDTASPLNDINPADIERIEVIKGAAATTLYGTEAAAGVIQIFTKRGHQGGATWNASVETGFAHEQKFGYTGELPPSEKDTKAFCDASGNNCGDPAYLYINPFLRNALRQNYQLSVGGGGEALQYFVSGGYTDNEGVLPKDREKKTAIRGNFTFSPTSSLRLQWNTSFTNEDLQNTPAGNNAQGITLNTYRRNRNYVGEQTIAAVEPLLSWDITTNINHLITGLTTTWTPLAKLTNRLTVGYDLSQQDNRNNRPFGFPLQPTGVLSDRRYEYTALTFDYVGSYDFQLSDALRSNFSWGGQSITTETQQTSAYGENFPGPGDPVVSNAGLTLGFESRVRVINAGFFFQNLFDFKNRYFLTGGVRVDGNSAFGQNLGLQAYPKVSASWIVSDEDFWPDSWGALKVRSALGQSGRAPGAFDAIRTYSAAGWGTQPAFLPNSVGNPDLGPERSTEFEIGAETSLFNDRLSLDGTYYYRKTTDALFSVQQIPSLGFLGGQNENVGSLEGKGIELSGNVSVIRTPNLSWDLGGSIYTNKSKVLSLGGAVPFSIGNFGYVVEGQPVPVIRARCVTNPDEKADPIIENDCNIGPNQPTKIFGVNSTLSLPKGISVTARGEYQGGNYMYDGGAWNAVTRSVRWPGCFAAYKVQEEQGIDAMTALQRAQCLVQFAQADFFIYPAEFFKIRELTLQVPLPQRLMPGSTRSTLTLSGRNIFKWVNKDFPVFEPEMGNNDGFDTQVRALLEHIPSPAMYTLALRVTF